MPDKLLMRQIKVPIVCWFLLSHQVNNCSKECEIWTKCFLLFISVSLRFISNNNNAFTGFEIQAFTDGIPVDFPVCK